MLEVNEGCRGPIILFSLSCCMLEKSSTKNHVSKYTAALLAVALAFSS